MIITRLLSVNTKAAFMGRPKGKPNRPHPTKTLEDSLLVAQTIQDEASGMAVEKLTLAELLDKTPSGNQFRELVISSRAYGLTDGGKASSQFKLLPLGQAATGGDEVAREEALKKAVLNVEPFKVFLESFDGKKVPAETVLRSFLTGTADVPEAWAEECAERVLIDARYAGFLRDVKGSEYVTFGSNGTRPSTNTEDDDEADSEQDGLREGDAEAESDADDSTQPATSPPTPPTAKDPDVVKKLFVAHGKDRSPLDTLKQSLAALKVPFAVAVDEPHAGRPISAKVASLMRDECSSAIFIFTADERFLRENEDGTMEEVWRPSENAVYELGAASILYGKRIVIFKEKRVSLPSDFSDLGYIEFESDQFGQQMGSLVGELVALDILEIRAKG